MTDNEDRPPGAGLKGLEGTMVRRRRVALQEALQQWQDCHEGVTPAEVEDEPLPDPSVVAYGLDDTHILMDDTGGTGNLDGADEQDVLAS